MEYFKKHPAYVATVHFVGGLGLGSILGGSVFTPHPLRWGAGLIALAIAGHIYAWVRSSK